MFILDSAKKISKLVFDEYERLLLEYKSTNVMPSFKSLEDILYLENKFYSMLKDSQLEWMRKNLSERELAPYLPHFFDFFYCIGDNEKFFYSRISSRCSVELEKRETENHVDRYQTGYFPIKLEDEDPSVMIENEYRMFDCLHLHQFLTLLEENEYFTSVNKMETKILISYIYPIYERYFLKKHGDDSKTLDSIYSFIKESLLVDEEYFSSMFRDCFEYVSAEIEEFSDILSLECSSDAFQFLYLSCYIKGLLRLREGVLELEDNSNLKELENILEEHYQKVLER